ncbi:hypothetical protein ACWEK5_45970 [Rhodococcus koreensis]
MFEVGEVAMNHFSDWSHWSWILWSVLLVLAGALAVAAVIGVIVLGELRDDRLQMQLFGITALLGLVSFFGLTVVLINITRHLPAGKWSVLVVLVAVGVVASVQAVVVRAAVTEYFVDSVHPWVWRSAALIVAAIGVVAIVNDGLNRVAASIPTSVTFVVQVVVVGVVGVGAYLYSNVKQTQ